MNWIQIQNAGCKTEKLKVAACGAILQRAILFLNSALCFAPSQGFDQFHPLAVCRGMKANLRLQVHGGQNLQVQIRLNVPMQLFPGTPLLQIQDPRFFGVVLNSAAGTSCRSAQQALHMMQNLQDLFALFGTRNDSQACLNITSSASKNSKFEAQAALLNFVVWL